MPERPNKKVPKSPPGKAQAPKVRASRKRAVEAEPAQLPNEAAADAEFSHGWVTVRMYRDILGDCFLLRFPSGDKAVHVLIDCGILQGMPGARERARRIMANIKSVTTRLDVLVATHEHVDHLSGFSQARDLFDGIAVDQLWLAWTEDAGDEMANRLRRGRGAAMALVEGSYAALAPLVATTRQREEEEEEEDIPDALAGLHGLMAFSGLEPAGKRAPGDATTAGILNQLREKAARVRYFKPGEPILSLGAPGVAVYVLGPPRDDVMIRRSNPSRKGREVYELRADGFDDDVFLVAAMARESERPQTADELAKLRMSLPFGHRSLIALDPGARSIGARTDTAAINAFQGRYGASGAAWRRIDTDWLGAVEQLALKLDSDTNNTSLVLAFAIGDGPDSPVLLFPGDAQVGNWLSWDDHVWPSGKVRGEIGAVDASQLLARTVLYKVGHHGSHNATLRERGLELMTHPELVAMVPVHEEFANKTKNWNMPFPSLIARLGERCAGRVIRADRGRDDLVDEAARRAGKPGQLSQGDWDRFLGNVREISDAEGPVAIEYRIAAAIPEAA